MMRAAARGALLRAQRSAAPAPIPAHRAAARARRACTRAGGGSMSAPSSVPRLKRSDVCFLLCDVQERFRSVIHNFEAMQHGCSIMVRAAPLVGAPVIVTEQYPKVRYARRAAACGERAR